MRKQFQTSLSQRSYKFTYVVNAETVSNYTESAQQNVQWVNAETVSNYTESAQQNVQ